MSKKETPSEGNDEYPGVLVEADQILNRYETRRARLPFIKAGLAVLVASVGILAVLEATDGRVTKTLFYSQCDRSDLLIPAVTRAERAADYQRAINLANSFLSDPAVCQANRQILARQVFVDRLEIIYAQSPDINDFPAQQRAVQQYNNSRLFLDRSKVPAGAVPTRIQIAQRALQSNQLHLGRQAISEANYRGEIDITDSNQLRLVYKVWNRLGESLFKVTDNDIYRSQGLGLIASASDLNQRFSLGELSARETLLRNLGENSLNWPRPSEQKIRPRTN